MRSDDTNGAFSPPKAAMPAWVRTVAYLVGVLGFPIIVALFLLAQTGGLIASPLTETRAAVADVRAGLAAHLIQEEHRTRLLRAICRHTARTELERRECDPPGRGEFP